MKTSKLIKAWRLNDTIAAQQVKVMKAIRESSSYKQKVLLIKRMDSLQKRRDIAEKYLQL